MPRVSEEYINKKRNEILDCAQELIKEMPLYSITMRDMIKRLSYSQGAIYRYYKSVDEVFADLMNREIADIGVLEEFNKTIDMQLSFEEGLYRLFELFGKYVYEVQRKVGGKFYYEIQVAYMFDYEKQQKLFERLEFKKTLMQIQEKLVQYIIENVKKENRQMKYPLENFIEYVCATIDGICNAQAVLMENKGQDTKKDILEKFKMLAEYCQLCFE